MNKRYLILVVLAVALLGGGALYYYFGSSAKAVAPVTAAVTRGDVIAKVDATGTLQPVTTVQVGSQVSGIIKALHADFNSEVHKDQVVAELEPSVFQSEVDQARATLSKLQADADRAKVDVDDSNSKLRRAQQLSDQGLIAATDLETAKATAAQAAAAVKSAQAQITQSRAALSQAEVNLSHTIIKAPIDGVVISRSVDVGQTVAASLSAPVLFVIAQDLARMQVNASVDESDIGRIAMGQKVVFRVDAYPNQTFSGNVSQVRLNSTVSQNVVSYTTMIDVPNPDLKLKPGMTANVTIQIASNENVLRVPSTALRFKPAPELYAALGQSEPAAAATSGAPDVPTRATGTTGRRGGSSGSGAASESGGAANASAPGRVWVLRNGALESVRVRTGVTDGAFTAIVGGDLKEGDQVVTAMTNGTPTSAAATTTANPLLPAGRRGGGGGGGGARPGAGR